VQDHTLLINALPWHWLVALVLATLVQFHVGWTFYRSAWSGLRHGSANMSVLVVLGTSAAYLYSAISIVSVGEGGCVSAILPDDVSSGSEKEGRG
jgi:Cu+-exporting ATPase